MIATLHKHLTRELVKTVVLSAALLTLVMTTFVIIEPLRQRGLGPSQVLRFFWYMVPVMLSLTLPVAALFAATIVYGRFSMDNELTACRASGISTYSVLKPALMMGAVVSAISLTLTFAVTPRLAEMGEKAARANLRGLVYQGLKSRNYWRYNYYWIHADSCDEASNTMQGVVVINAKNQKNISYTVASHAKVDFTVDRQTGEDIATIRLTNPVTGQQARQSTGSAGLMEYVSFPIPPLLREDASFYDWQTLRQILENPQKSPEVQKRLVGIRRSLRLANLYADVAKVLPAADYELVRAGGGRIIIKAGTPAWVDRGERLILGVVNGEPGGETDDRTVVLEIRGADGDLEHLMRARSAEMAGDYVPTIGKAQIALNLFDMAADSGPHQTEYLVGPLDMPEHIQTSVDDVALEDLYQHPERYPAVAGGIRALSKYIETNLQLKVIAEMHGRIAYGLGCFLMVAVGGGLGLVFRGGQLLTAFAISCIPGLTLAVMIVMGKQMISNPGAPMYAGIAAVWSGVGILALMVAHVYGVRLRR